MPSPAARWAVTRTMILLTSWPAAASAAARRMSRRTTPTAARQSTGARPAIPVTASAPSSESRSKNRSAAIGLPRARLHAACLAERHQPPLGNRRAHDPPSRLPHQHHQAKADRRTVRLRSDCRERGCTPHVSQNDTNRRSAIDGRTTRHPGYRISTIKRKQIEEPFGWIKTVGGLRKTRHCGRALVEWFFVLTAAAYNLIRIPKILAAMG